MAIAINPLSDAIKLLQDFGFFQVILPMILVFAIFYGILTSTKIFGSLENAQYLNAVIAFVAAFFTITQTTIVKAINEFIPQASFLLIVVMLFLMMFAFFGIKTQSLFDKPAWWIWIPVIILSVIFLGVIDMSLGWNIPIIHQVSQSFSSGGGAGVSTGGISDEAIGMGISLAILLAIPLLIIYLMVKAK